MSTARSGPGLGFEEVFRNSLAPEELPALVLQGYAGSPLEKVGIPSGPQINKAFDAIKKGWPTTVGVIVPTLTPKP